MKFKLYINSYLTATLMLYQPIYQLTSLMRQLTATLNKHKAKETVYQKAETL
jgi:hypothetical protein